MEYSKCPSKLRNVIRNVTGGGCARHCLSIPVDELSSDFASLVSSGTGNAPLHVPEGPDMYGAFREFSPLLIP